MQQQTFVSGNQPQVSTIVKNNSSASTMDSKNNIIANTMVESNILNKIMFKNNITASTNSANPNIMLTKNSTCLTSKKDQKQKVPVQVQPSDLHLLHHTRMVHLDHEDIPFHSSMHLQNNFAVRAAVPVQDIG